MLRIFGNNHLALLLLTTILTAWHPAVGCAQAGNPAVADLQYALIGDKVYLDSCVTDENG
jgi:hypothetical protein